jgi:hypothetical protein
MFSYAVVGSFFHSAASVHGHEIFKSDDDTLEPQCSNISGKYSNRTV